MKHFINLEDLSTDDLNQIIDHATLNRRVIRYAPAIAAKAQSQKRNTNCWILHRVKPFEVTK
jgi:transposase-like protein